MKKPIIPKKMKITLLVLLLISIFSFIGAFTILYNSDYKLSNYKDEVSTLLGIDKDVFDTSTWFEEEVTSTINNKETLKGITSIEINSYKNSNIRLTSSNNDDNTLFLEYTYSGRKSIVEKEKNSFLKFSKKSGTLILNLDNTNEKLYNMSSKISIPKSFKGSITINPQDSYSGDLYINNMDISSLNVNSSSRIDLNKVTANSLNLQSSNIYLNSVKSDNVNLSSDYIEGTDVDFKSSNIYSNSSVTLNGYIGDSNVKAFADIALTLKDIGKNTTLTSIEHGNISLSPITNFKDFDIVASSENGEIISPRLNISNGNILTVGKATKHITIKSYSGNIEL